MLVAAMISDYADLMVASHEYAGRNDIAHLFARFLGMAETKFNRLLRIAEMEGDASIPVTTGEGPLPADFLVMRDARVSATSAALRAMPLSELKTRYSRGGIPIGYAIVGTNILLRPTWSGDLLASYYKKIPALTLSNTTNWLLSAAPNAYLYAIVEQIALWERDLDKAAAAGGLLMSEINALQSADSDKRWSNARVMVGGCTP